MIKKVTDIVNGMDGNEAVDFLINNEDCYVVSKDVLQRIKRDSATEAVNEFVSFAQDEANDAWFLYETLLAYNDKMEEK